MTRHGPHDARVTVFTFREGALSAIGHDLAIEARVFSLDIDDEDVTLVVDAASLVVRAARVAGADDARALSSSDKDKIARAIADDVLHARRFAEIRATARVPEGREGRASLTLHGVTREVPFVVDRLGVDKGADTVRVTASFAPSLFGIRPYSALLGALRVKDSVTVEIEARAPRA